jgi:5'-nucleotidase
MPTLLITNDDGVRSPFLPRMVERLKRLGTVRMAVPAEEHSWKAKAMTRFGRIQPHARNDFGVEAYALTGTPSDCVNIALHHLFPDKPDWVISGINIGWNVGAAFAVNSGTVGAAFEAALGGVPAVAFSVRMPPELFQQWITEKNLAGPEAERLLDSTTERMGRMMEALLERGLPPGAMILNVNFPGAVRADTPAHWVPLEDNRYGSLFVPDGGGFIHRFQHNLTVVAPGPSDRQVVVDGGIAVTGLNLAGWNVPAPAQPPLE